MAEQTGVEPDENGLFRGVTGRTVQVWHGVSRTRKGHFIFWFTRGKDPKPLGDWMIHASAEKGVVCGVMAATFREKAKPQDDDGMVWALDLYSGPGPILYEFRRCAACGGADPTHSLGLEWFHAKCRRTS